MAESATGSTAVGSKTSPILIAVAWLVVAAPLAWGVSHTVQSAMKLFNSTPAAAVPHP